METNILNQLQQLQDWFLVHNLGVKQIYVLSIFMLFAYLVVLVSKKIRVPIVVGYVFLGIFLSVNLVELAPIFKPETKEWYPLLLETMDYIPQLALAFIAFTIGSELSVKTIKKMGKPIFYIVTLQALSAFALVTLGVLAIGQPLFLALIFGAIASATAPAATVMVIQEYDARGPVTSMIMAVVGIDDAIALIIYSLISPIAFILYSGEGTISFATSVLTPMEEILGSILLGTAIGYLAQKYIVNTEDKTIKILALLTTLTGSTALALFFHFSALITNMAIGFAFRNFARKNPEIESYMKTLTIPLYAIFFILAGTEIKFTSITSTTFIILATVYTIMRVIGKIGGTNLAANLAGAQEKIKKYVGLGLLPQSGVAIALAYQIQKQYSATPKIGLLVFNIILFTSVLTEVFGPLATKYALTRAGETRAERNKK
ncbi:MAG: cation:proton antiporter [Halanaerobiales bacterium]